MELNLACVIVTYNRLNYLKKRWIVMINRQKCQIILLLLIIIAQMVLQTILMDGKKRDMDLNVLFCTCQKILVGAVAFIVVAKRP